MKKLLFSLLAVALSFPLSASTYLVLQPVEGNAVTFYLSDTPELSFSGSDVVIGTRNEQVTYNRAQVRKFYFSDETNSIDNVKNVSNSETIIMTLDGRVVSRQGNVANLSELGRGVYIVKNGNNTFKVLNK